MSDAPAPTLIEPEDALFGLQQRAPPVNFYVSAVPAGAKAAVLASIRSAETAEDAMAAVGALAAEYAPPAYTIRVITTRRCCEEERLALRMLAHATPG